MGYTPDFARASEDRGYTALVWQAHIRTGNVSYFDRSTLSYACSSASLANDVLVDNAIEYVSALDNVRRALMDISGRAWDRGDLVTWQLSYEVFNEVHEEIGLIDAWLEGDES